LIQLIIAPAQGWDDIAADEESQWKAHAQKNVDSTRDEWEESRALLLQRLCFIPIIAICACSVFVRMLFDVGPTFLQALQQAIIAFVSLFLSAQFSRYIFQTYMPGWVEKTSDGQPLVNRGRWLEVIMYSLTILAVIMLVSNVIKVRLALVEFLPLYVVFVIWKGCKFVHIEEQNVGIFMVSAIASLLGSVYVLSAILKALI
jgi:hypothetical protein